MASMTRKACFCAGRCVGMSLSLVIAVVARAPQTLPLEEVETKIA
jgi:hypothetical protein